MTKIIITVLTLLFLNMGTTNAQEFFRLKESIGMPLRSRSYTNLKGTPYFIDNWSKGIIKQANGQSVKDIELRYDQVADQLTFKDLAGNEMAFAVPITEFKLLYDGGSAIFRNGYAAFKDSNEKSYYQVLVDGAPGLLKKNFKKLQEYREYNSATVTNMVLDRIKYFVVSDGKLTEVKRDNKLFEVLFANHNVAILQYIKENKLDLKKDDELIKAFSFATSLK